MITRSQYRRHALLNATLLGLLLGGAVCEMVFLIFVVGGAR
jgi:hypothetical protein